MRQRRIGDREVSAIGLGGMPMSIEGRPDHARSIATIHAALEAGVTLIDTADAYHRDPTDVGHNELLIAKALRLAGVGPDEVLVATKGGHRRPGDGTWYTQGDPAYLKLAPARAGDPRRAAGLGAEPVLATLPELRAGAGAVRRDGDRVPAVEPTRRDRAGR